MSEQATETDSRPAPLEIIPLRTYLEGDSDREFVIDCIFPAASLTLLTGPSGIGKTKFALATCRAVGSGVIFMDQFVEKGKILYFNLDRMHRGDIQDRVKDLCQGDEFEDWADEIYFYEGELNALGHLVDDNNQHFINESGAVMTTKEYLTDVCKDFKLVFFDTLHKLAVDAGLDEKEADDMDRLMICLRDISRESGAAVVLLHHTPISDEKRSRGSTAIVASSDHVLAMYAYNRKDGLKSIQTKCRLDVVKTRSDRIQIFPITIGEQIELNLVDTEEIGEPTGGWKGLINMNMARYSDVEKRRKIYFERFERWMWVNGEKISSEERSAHRNTILRLFQGKKQVLDMVRSHFKKIDRLTTTKGNNPLYTLRF